MSNNNNHTPQLHDVDAILDALNHHHAILLIEEGKIEAWSSNHKLPVSLRRGIRRHNETLQALLYAHDVRLCPSPQLHKRYWRQRKTGYICGLCERLDEAIQRAQEGKEQA